MRVAVASHLEISYEIDEDPPEVFVAMDAANNAGIVCSWTYVSLQDSSFCPPDSTDVVIADAHSVSDKILSLSAPTAIVLFSDRVEIRQYEKLSEDGSKFAVHTERIDGASRNWNERKFHPAFFRQLALDPSDLRKAVVMGAKLASGGVLPPVSVV